MHVLDFLEISPSQRPWHFNCQVTLLLYLHQCNVGWAGNGHTCGLDSDIDGYPDESLPCIDNDKHCKPVCKPPFTHSTGTAATQFTALYIQSTPRPLYSLYVQYIDNYTSCTLHSIYYSFHTHKAMDSAPLINMQ